MKYNANLFIYQYTKESRVFAYTNTVKRVILYIISQIMQSKTAKNEQ